MDGTIGMVLSGGGARGAYEFGALEVLAPVLDEPARIIVGTSAGALGAAYLAANAHDSLEVAARTGGEKWLAVEIGDVIGPSRRVATRSRIGSCHTSSSRRPTGSRSGACATDVYNRHYAGAHGLHHNRELALLGRLLDAGRNPVRGDLLSYLFFAPEFIEPLIELGRRDAQAWLDRQGRAAPGAPSTRGPPRELETPRLRDKQRCRAAFRHRFGTTQHSRASEPECWWRGR